MERPRIPGTGHDGKGRLIFARDKNGMVSIYKEEDATPENYQKVNRYRRASGNGSPGNNGFASHSMQPDAEGASAAHGL